MAYTIYQQAKIIAAPGAVAQTADVLRDSGYSRPLLVFDQGVKACGIAQKVIDVISAAGYKFTEFADVVPDPPSDVVEAAHRAAVDGKCDCVIAIGGGSSIDTAKGVVAMLHNPGRTILDFADPSVQMNRSPGLISIPTTAGTGSELSNGIIITDTATQVKVPIVGDKAMSEYVILDPELTLGMPLGLTLMTGLDVFSHAMEAYTTVLAGPMTDIICEKIMQDVVEFLPRVVRDGSDLYARQRMLDLASLGGWMLYNCCAHVGHSIAHTIGAKMHIPHGAACAYGAPATIRFIAPAVPEKVRKIGEILGARFDGTEDAEAVGRKAADAYVAFRDGLGLKPLSDYNIGKAAALALAKDVSVECFAPLSPRKVTEEDAYRMLDETF